MDPKGTQAYIHKEDNDEISVLAAQLKRPRTQLFHLLALIPIKEVRDLADKYLGPNKKRHPSKE